MGCAVHPQRGAHRWPIIHRTTSGFSSRKQRNMPRSGAAAGMPNLGGSVAAPMVEECLRKWTSQINFEGLVPFIPCSCSYHVKGIWKYEKILCVSWPRKSRGVEHVMNQTDKSLLHRSHDFKYSHLSEPALSLKIALDMTFSRANVSIAGSPRPIIPGSRAFRAIPTSGQDLINATSGVHRWTWINVRKT